MTMRHIKPLLIYWLCLTLLVTQETTAFARGKMAFGQTLQICAMGVPSVITLDARGNPVDAPHPCPDCLAVTAGLPLAPFEFAQPSGGWRGITMPIRALLAHQSTVHPLARGPPVLI